MNFGLQNISVDMFADAQAAEDGNLSTLHDFEVSLLDLTMDEMAADMSSIVRKPVWDAWKNVSLANMCGPAMRSFLLHKAIQECEAEGTVPSALAVMYETAALSIWTLWKFQLSLPPKSRCKPLTKGILLLFVCQLCPETVRSPPVFHRINAEKISNVIASNAGSGNKLLDLCRASKNTAPKPAEPTPPVSGAGTQSSKTAAGVELRTVRDKLAVTGDMLHRCRQLPAAWTVLQLCKSYNPQQFIQTAAERFSCPLPLNLTVFSGARSELLDDSDAPLRVTIWPNSGSAGHDAAADDPSVAAASAADVNFFQLAYDTSQEINNEQRRRTPGGAAAAAASAPNTASTTTITATLDQFCQRLRRFLGPWLVLLCGQARSARARRTDAIAFRTVDQHCGATALRFTARQRLAASRIARATVLLDRADLLAGATYIADTEDQYVALVGLFLHHLPNALAAVGRSTAVEPDDYHPTVLIVDEQVDFVYWEMAVPQLQQSRVSSLALLFRLVDHYGERLRGAADGVLPVPVRRGLVLSNPDNTLAGSGQRMQLLFELLRPQYRTIYGRAPLPDEMQSALAAADVYVYAGHGNGLQFVGGRELADTELRAVAFLYGCESVALKATGGQSEPVGAHLYLQYALCPAVVGMLNVTTDVWTDIVTLGLSVMWLGGGGERDARAQEAFLGEWNAVHGHRTAVYADVSRLMLAKRPQPELLAVLQQMRCMPELPLRMRMVLVARGLPVRVDDGLAE